MPGPACGPGVTWALGRDERAPRRVHSHLCLPQPFSKSATEHVQGHLVKRQVPPDLFQVCADLFPTASRPGQGHLGQVREPDQLLLWHSRQPLPSSLSRTSKRFVRTSEGTCSRNSLRGESGCMPERSGEGGRGCPEQGVDGVERSQPALGPGQGRAWARLHPSEETPQRLGRQGHCLPHTPAILLSPKPVPGSSPGTMGPPVSPSLPRTV